MPIVSGCVGAVDSVERGAEIERAGAERIVGSPVHVAGQVGLTQQHFRRRRPVRPFGLAGDRLDAAPFEARTADPDPVAQRAAIAEHQEEKFARRVDDDGAGLFRAVIVDFLLGEDGIDGAADAGGNRRRRAIGSLSNQRPRWRGNGRYAPAAPAAGW